MDDDIKGIKPIILDDDNHPKWSISMRFRLLIKGLWSIVELDTPLDDMTAANRALNSKALAHIGLCVSDYLQDTVSRCTTANEAWTTLEEMFRGRSEARRTLLRRELTHLKMQRGESLLKYWGRATELRSELATTGHIVSDDDLRMSVLAGLPTEYSTHVAIVQMQDEQPSLGEMLSKMMIIEQATKSENTSAAYLTSGPRSRPFSGARANFDLPQRSNVPQRFNPPRFNPQAAFVRGPARPTHRGFSSQAPRGNPAAYRSTPPPGGNRSRGPRCYGCNEFGHIRRECPKERNGPPQQRSVALAASRSKLFEDDVWVVDSGSSYHITHERSMFGPELEALPQPITVNFANGEKAHAAGVGNIVFDAYTGDSGSSTTKITLHDALYVPDAKVNLLSVQSATKRGATFEFGQQGGMIKSNGETVATAEFNNGVYTLRMVDRSATALAVTETPQLVHRRYGHLGFDNLAKLVTDNMVTGINITADEFRKAKTEPCDPCILAKHPRSPFPASETKTTECGQLIHTDLCGPFKTPSLGHSEYFLTMIDDYSGYSMVEPLRNKFQTSEALQKMILLFEKFTGKEIRILRSDNGGEYVARSLKEFLLQKGIRHEMTVPYTPQQNGVAERLNRTLMERVLAMLNDAGLPDSLWAEALKTANEIRNRSPAAGKDRTPWEYVHGDKPDVSFFRVFGATAYAHTPKDLRDKLQPHSRKGRFVGYDDLRKGYRILLDGNKEVIISRDVLFFEEDSSTSKDVAKEEGDPPDGDSDMLDADGSDDDVPPPPPPVPPVPRRSEREHRQPVEYWRVNPQEASALFAEVAPVTYKDAINSPDHEQWLAGMHDELESLMAHSTWEIVPAPPDARVIPVKWHYALKRDSTGKIVRHKARLVVKGFHQREGIDFDEVYAPVSKHATVRFMLSHAAAEDCELHQLDIKTAFLNGDLEEDVYVQQPPGFHQGDSNMVCHLKKALYGLRQAPRQWHKKLDAALEKYGFYPTMADASLYVRRSKDSTAYLLTYVDDILIICHNLAEVNEIKAALMTTFEAHDMGEAKFFLGMSIERDREHRTIKLGQERLVNDLMDKFSLTDCKPKYTPMASLVTGTEGDPLDTERFPYMSLVGSLLYLSCCTRPDISQPVGVLARYMSKPTTTLWTAAKGVLRYVASTKDFGLVFGTGSGLIGYCDADFASDTESRRSTTGYVFLLNGGAVSWNSKRQPTVAVSTTEAEYMAASAAVKEALWLRKLMADVYDLTPTIKIFGDNQSAIKLLKNPVSSQRSKHIDVIYHFARERVARGEVEFDYISSAQMLADMLTKIVPKVKLEYCRKGIGML